LAYNVDMAVLLKRFDPEEHINRWYSVHVQPTLLDPVAVICAWGSWETNWQQTRVLPVVSFEEAEALAGKIVTAKIKRGYQRIVE